MKKYYKNNSKSIKEYVKKYKENNRDKCNALEMKRYTKKKQRTPSWIDEEELFLIQEAYSLAKLREKFTGIEWQVDHIVPLQGKIVSGFHVPSNLQVIPRIENQSKHAKWDWDEQ